MTSVGNTGYYPGREWTANVPAANRGCEMNLSTGQKRGLAHIRDGEWHRAAHLELGYYSPGHRAQINVLQSLVARGFAQQRHASSKTVAATWRITEAGRIACDLVNGAPAKTLRAREAQP